MLAPHTLDEFVCNCAIVARHEPRENVVLVGRGELREPFPDFRRLRLHISERRARRGRRIDEIEIDPQELGETFEGGAELPETRGNTRLKLVIVEIATLCAQEPAQIQSAEIATGKFRSYRNQR